MSDQPQVDPAQLAEAIKGMSDDELKQSISDMGVDETLKNIFTGMQEAFNPAKAQNAEAVMVYEVETDQGAKPWTVTIANGSCSVSEGTADSPRLTLKLPLVDFIRLIFGQADGTQLFMTGKMKLQGDMMFAMQMQGMFDRPA